MIHLAPYVRKQVANAVRLNCFNLQNIDYFLIKKKMHTVGKNSMTPFFFFGRFLKPAIFAFYTIFKLMEMGSEARF